MNEIIKIKIGHDYVFTFGKYKGQSISQVLKKECAYIIWCSKKFDWFELERDVKIDVIFNIISEKPSRYVPSADFEGGQFII
jgi:hypothetical protein